MAVTTDNITKILEKVISVLKIEDENTSDLAIGILTLAINYIGAENIMGAMEDGLENTFEYLSDLITGESSDLTAEERGIALDTTRSELDGLFVKLSAVSDPSAV